MSEPDMRLPVGGRCGTCAHWTRCKALIESLQETNTTCDWSPSRFLKKYEPPDKETSDG